MKIRIYIVLFFTAVSCSSGLKENTFQNIQLNDYWYQGKAEVSSYALKQARYGEVHEGEAVLIFVTEDFSKSKNVKLDNPSANPKDRLPVLKMNMTRKFFTGVYPYSMMLSTFTPTNQPQKGLTKLTATSQEWCGHTFTQLESKSNKYTVNLYSYFESEGDQRLSLNKAILEDELWTLIRIDPKLLPLGDFEIIPGMLFQRLRHIEIRATEANATLLNNADGTSVYTVNIPEHKRELKIVFKTKAPHEIQTWTENYRSGFGDEAKLLTTTATLKKRALLDYWSKHNLADSTYRKQLQLKTF